MVRLVFSIVFLVILAVFIAFNAQYNTDINLFGFKMENVSVVAVVLLTLVTGVVYSFGLYLITFFSKRSSNKEKNLKKSNQAKAKALKEQEQVLQTAKETLENPASALPPTEDLSAAVSGAAAAGRPKKKRGLRKKK